MCSQFLGLGHFIVRGCRGEKKNSISFLSSSKCTNSIHSYRSESTGLALVELNTNIFECYHENVEVDKNYNYALAAVDNENREGPPAQTSVQ